MKQATMRNQEEAQAAVMRFWTTFSLNVGQAATFGAETGSFAGLDPFVSEVSPLPRSRLNQDGKPVDLFAPSPWHALAFLTVVEVTSRSRRAVASDAEAFESLYGRRPVYRGQARPWRIMPSGWRGGSQSDNAWRREVFQKVLSSNAQEIDDPVLTLVGSTAKQVEADAIGQHYGMPTNLIDFTFNPVAALHFACSDAEDRPFEPHDPVAPENCAVIFFAPVARDAIRLNAGVLLPPVQLERLYRQAGFFLDLGAPGPERDKSALLESQLARVFFPRPYPVVNAREVIRSTIGELEPPDPFVDEVARQVNAARPDPSVLATDAAARIANDVKNGPSWRTARRNPVMMLTDDELLAAFHRIEYYIRFAALLNVAGQPRLDPVIVGQMGPALGNIMEFAHVREHFEKLGAEQRNSGESALSSTKWFSDRCMEAYKTFLYRPT